MNKADITLKRLEHFETLKEAMDAIHNPVKHFGYSLTLNERTYCIAYVKVLFALREERGKHE